MDSKQLVVLDEAQSWGEIFPRTRGAIDEHPRRKGRFLLLGSASPSLMTRVEPYYFRTSDGYEIETLANSVPEPYCMCRVLPIEMSAECRVQSAERRLAARDTA